MAMTETAAANEAVAKVEEAKVTPVANRDVASQLQLTEMQIAELREAFQLFDKVGITPPSETKYEKICDSHTPISAAQQFSARPLLLLELDSSCVPPLPIFVPIFVTRMATGT